MKFNLTIRRTHALLERLCFILTNLTTYVWANTLASFSHLCFFVSRRRTAKSKSVLITKLTLAQELNLVRNSSASRRKKPKAKGEKPKQKVKSKRKVGVCKKKVVAKAGGRGRQVKEGK